MSPQARTLSEAGDIDGAIYTELKRLAQHYLRSRAANMTLSTTDLLHEAYLKFGGADQSRWQSRAHFFGSASVAMRQVLVDYARHRKAEKRGGGVAAITLTGNHSAIDMPLDELIALDDALNRLRDVDERLCKLVELRFFAGLNEEETAEVLGVTSRTVRRDWTKARLFLSTVLSGT